MFIACTLGKSPLNSWIAYYTTDKRVDVQVLARERAEFGDPASNSEGYERIASGMSQAPSEFYFPFGRADVRYYLNFVDPNSAGYGQPFLVKEVNVSGKVKVSWTLRLSANGTKFSILAPDDYGKKGTLYLFLERRGLLPIKSKLISPDARKDLNLRMRLAGYRMRDPVYDYLWYWAVDDVGNPELPQEIGYSSSNLPKSSVPLPISKTETDLINGKKG